MGVQIPEAAALLLKESNTLVSMPEICLRLRTLLDDPDHSLDDVCKLIIHDPSLTVRVLKIVNSAYYGMPSRIQSISHALNVLGEAELHTLVIVTAIYGSLNNMKSSINMKRFWQSSMYSAVLAQNLQNRMSQQYRNSREEVFIAGLLLNVGRLIIYYNEPDLLAFVRAEMARRSVNDYTVEQEQLGFNHADVGACMARQWNFDKNIIDAIGGHHIYRKDTGPLQPVYFTASLIADARKFNDEDEDLLENLDLACYGIPQCLGMPPEEFSAVISQSHEDFLQAFDTFCCN